MCRERVRRITDSLTVAGCGLQVTGFVNSAFLLPFVGETCNGCRIGYGYPRLFLLGFSAVVSEKRPYLNMPGF